VFKALATDLVITKACFVSLELINAIDCTTTDKISVVNAGTSTK